MSLILGSIMVGHHSLNVESKKYFNQVMCMSGTAIVANTFGLSDHQCVLEIFANRTKSIENDEQLIEFMQSAPLDDIIGLTKATSQNVVKFVWVPIIESKNI